MKLREIVEKVNKDNAFKSEVDIRDFASNAFNLNFFGWYEQDKLVSYYFIDWHCTDSRVGYKVYFFEDKPVALSSQLGRKCDEDIEWISKEDYLKVKEFALSFMNEDVVTLVDLEQEFGDHFKIEFTEQLYKHHIENAYLNNEKVEIVDIKYGIINSTLDILLNGEKKTIDVNDLSFKYNLYE